MARIIAPTPRRRPRARACALLVPVPLASTLLLASALGCKSRPDSALVYAAEPLGPVVTELAAAAEAAGAPWKVKLGPDPELAAAIEDGDRPDVYLSANRGRAAERAAQGYGEPEMLARGRLVVVTPAANKARVDGIRDLGRDGVRVVLARPTGPVGLHTRVALARAGVNASRQVVGQVDSAAEIFDKLLAGEADAAIVYATDVGPHRDKLLAFRIDEGWQPEVGYWLVAEAEPREVGEAALERLRSDDAEALLQKHAFELPVQKKAPPPAPEERP